MQRGSPPSSPAANRHSKPSLCLSRSSFPGNGISGPEKNAQKRPAGCNDAVSENEPSHRSPPIRGLSYTFRKSPVARDCVVGPRGFEPPTRPLYPDVSGAYASHRLPIIARYFLERRTIGIVLRCHVRRLRFLSGVDFVEQFFDQ